MSLVEKTSVPNFASLPALGNTDGDLRRTTDTMDVYRWNALTTTWVIYTTISAPETIDASKLVGAFSSAVNILNTTGAPGDISAVVAGTGLTGGGTSGSVTLNVDVGTSANKIVQLDGSAKLPAVDGSQLTNLPATGDITDVVAGTGLTGGGTSGSVTLNVDVGTSANQIVQLDGSAKLPAVDGSQLTNLAAPSGVVLFKEFTYDFAVQGGSAGTKTLSGGQIPANSVVSGCTIIKITNIVGGSVLAIDVGGTNLDTGGYAVDGTSINTNGAAFDTIVGTSVVYPKVTSAADVHLVISGTAITAGKFRMILRYMPFTP